MSKRKFSSIQQQQQDMNIKDEDDTTLNNNNMGNIQDQPQPQHQQQQPQEQEATAGEDPQNRDSVRRSIQTDLETLQDTLLGGQQGQDATLVAAASSSSATTTMAQHSGVTFAGGGRAFMDSIRTALSSVRTRLEDLMVSEEENNNNEPASASASAVANADISNTTNDGSLMNLLQQMERAVSFRIPLGQLQSQLQQRNGVSTPNLQPQLPTETTADDANTNNNNRLGQLGQQRRPSTLLASRRFRQQQQEDTDKELHKSGTSAAPSISGKSSSAASSISSTHSNDDNLCMDIDDKEEKGESQTTKKVEEDEENEEVPILLTKSGHEKLDPAHRSVLFAQQDSLARSSSSLDLGPNSTQQLSSSSTTVYSWGLGVNSLHDSNTMDANTTTTTTIISVPIENARVDPTSRVGRSEILSVAASRYHTVCSTATGQVLVCGRNVSGAADPEKDNDNDNIMRPTLLESLSIAKVVQVSCGLDHTAALKANGTILTWGSNQYGQLGHYYSHDVDDGNSGIQDQQLEFCRPKTMALGAGSRATSVACGDGYTLVLTTRMVLLACGHDSMTCLAAPPGSSRPQHRLPAAIPALKDLPLVSMAAGKRHAIAITAHGSAFAWGNNENGCCGREYPKQLSVPVRIKPPKSKWENLGPDMPDSLSVFGFFEQGVPTLLSIAKDVAIVDATCGDDHTILVTKSGRLLVCGSNRQGQLGWLVDDDSNNKQEAVYTLQSIEHEEAALGRGFVRAEAGESHTILLDDVGDVWQLGGIRGNSDDGPSTTTRVREPPKRVLQAGFVKSIAAGGGQSIAIGIRPGRCAPRREFSYQPTDIEPPNHDCVEELLQNLSDDDDGDDHRELSNRAEELLRTPAVLNSLFLDPTDLEELFSKLLETDKPNTRHELFKAIETGIRRGLDTLDTDHTRLIHPEQVRFLWLYLQCPLFVDWKDESSTFDRRGDLILLLCDTILGLSYEGYKSLMSWVTSPIYSRDRFVRFLVRPLLAQLSKGLSAGAGAETRPVPAVVSVLKWLHNASERNGKIAEPEDFYLEDIDHMNAEVLLNDLMRYKKSSKEQRATDFVLCDTPFLFSPRAKRGLLQLENELNMFRTAASSGLTFNVVERTLEFDPFWKLEVEREHLLTQTLEKVGNATPTDLRKKLRVSFKGEDGVDAGGVTREFFQLLTAQLFDVNSGMWLSRFEDVQVTWFNSDCFWNDEGYYLCGVLVGLAVYNSVLLDVHFPPALYRKLLGLPLGLEDMVDEEVKSGLQTLLDYTGDDVEDVFCLSFDVAWSDLGQEKRKELKAGGSNIAVTSENKEEYVMLYSKFLLIDSIYPQYESFERGFMRVMEISSLELLRPEELELLVVGTPELDFAELEKNAQYEGGYDKDSPIIKHFWHFVKNTDSESQLRFLKFVTGSTRAPIGGLGQLPFKIQRAGPDSDQLPTSHTCFNTLLIPDYGDNYGKLEERLGRAILECEGFGLQ